MRSVTPMFWRRRRRLRKLRTDEVLDEIARGSRTSRGVGTLSRTTTTDVLVGYHGRVSGPWKREIPQVGTQWYGFYEPRTR